MGAQRIAAHGVSRQTAEQQAVLVVIVPAGGKPGCERAPGQPKTVAVGGGQRMGFANQFEFGPHRQERELSDAAGEETHQDQSCGPAKTVGCAHRGNRGNGQQVKGAVQRIIVAALGDRAGQSKRQ